MSEAVASKEPELVLRLIVVAVVFVDVKLTLCKSSAKSSSHGSIELQRERVSEEPERVT